MVGNTCPSSTGRLKWRVGGFPYITKHKTYNRVLSGFKEFKSISVFLKMRPVIIEVHSFFPQRQILLLMNRQMTTYRNRGNPHLKNALLSLSFEKAFFYMSKYARTRIVSLKKKCIWAIKKRYLNSQCTITNFRNIPLSKSTSKQLPRYDSAC